MEMRLLKLNILSIDPVSVQTMSQSDGQLNNGLWLSEVACVDNVEFTGHRLVVVHKSHQVSFTFLSLVRRWQENWLLNEMSRAGEVLLALAGLNVQVAKCVIWGVATAENGEHEWEVGSKSVVHDVEKAVLVRLCSKSVVDTVELGII